MYRLQTNNHHHTARPRTEQQLRTRRLPRNQGLPCATQRVPKAALKGGVEAPIIIISEKFDPEWANRAFQAALVT